MESKQKIYECAKILFFEKGFRNVTKKMVADLSGCNQGLINYYFKELGNIASLISAERYKIISSCVKRYVDIKNDPFAFEYTLKYYLHMINICYETAARFEKEAFEEIIFGHAAYDYAFREDLLTQLGYTDNQDISDLKADRHYELISALRMGMKGSYLSRIASGVEIPFDEYIHFEAKLMACAMDLDYDESRIASELKKAEKLAKKMWEENPDLRDPADFLYHKSILKEEPVLNLLNNVAFD